MNLLPVSQIAKLSGLSAKRDKALDIFVKTRDSIFKVNEELEIEKQKTKDKIGRS